ncbi:MAG: zinc ribbon domain-containing protein, partial [Myxococcota bacterium]
MTVFCPNCGKPNTDTATQCVSCGHELKPAGGSRAKFKGTMMMTAATAPKPGEAPGGAPPAGAPPQGQPPGGAGPQQPGAGKNLAFQATMLGPMTPPPAPRSGSRQTRRQTAQTASRRARRAGGRWRRSLA